MEAVRTIPGSATSLPGPHRLPPEIRDAVLWTWILMLPTVVMSATSWDHPGKAGLPKKPEARGTMEQLISGALVFFPTVILRGIIPFLTIQFTDTETTAPEPA